MGIALLFKNNLAGLSPYYRALNDLVSFSGEKLILSSGYTSVQDNTLFNNINRGFRNEHNSELITIAGNFKPYCSCTKSSNQGCHFDKYGDFILSLNFQCLSNQKRFLIDRYGNWHAKISMKIRNNFPIAMVIGSTNLSRTALGLIPGRGSHEADVLIWRDSYCSFTNSFSDLKEGDYWRFSPYYQGQEEELLTNQYKYLQDYINNNQKHTNALELY
ncbi:hypothetical protein ACFFJI_10665 [Allobacillus sp. GCM10007491]|uniref:Uncharacterized protein n=1 Tax=Allobacillus saliphilus TaxID=2912308 RepID=A0A941HRK3_9BACI|nr:hypothetical protein [Allobacillus saliphilus]MBR7552686.1 hypothetical protein [Allobacillus saliphilus]